MNKNLLALKAAVVSTFFCFALFSSVLYVSCTNKDKCENVECSNGGVCVDGVCSCLNGYSGANCDLADARKFPGVYKGINPCTGSNTFKIDTSINNRVFINMNIGSDTCAKNVNVSGTVVGDTITFPEQGLLDKCHASYAFSAKGYMLHDSLFITLRYDFPAFKDTCLFAGRK